MRIALAAVLWLILAPGIALAWGEDGHVIIARLAESRLEEKARAGVRELIGNRSISEKNICIWADLIRNSAEYRRKYPYNQTWHYIDLDAAEEKPDPAAEKFGDRNVLAAIDRFRKVLKDRNAGAEARKEALSFLVHFIADMHQPLHCAARNDDKGGNRVAVLYPGEKEPKRLHGVWDVDLVRAAMGELGAADYAKRLDGKISDADGKSWSDGEPKDWALEGHALARKHVYAAIPNDWPLDGKAFALDAEYVKQAMPVVEKQLQRAGVRLAKVLNGAFAEGELRP